MRRKVDGVLVEVDQPYELGRCIEDLRTARDWANTVPSLGSAIGCCIAAARAAQRVAVQVAKVRRRLAAAAGLASLLLLAAPAGAQAVVYTNVVNGRPQAEIVRETRPHAPAAPVPASIVDTPVLPRNYKRPLGPSSYVPPVRAVAAPAIPARQPQPWFVNGIYVGNAPSGNWTSTVIGRPVVDVNIIGTPRPRPR